MARLRFSGLEPMTQSWALAIIFLTPTKVTFLILGLTDPNFTGTQNGPTFPYKMQADGSLIRLGSYTATGGSRIASDSSGQPYYVILESVAQNGGDFKLTGFNQLFEAVWTKTFGGSLADTPQAILAPGDGYLLEGYSII